jgi:hypothetical protein
VIIVDDHLLGDVIGGTIPRDLGRLLRRHDVATTNLYYFRLCRAALTGRGGALTGGWSTERRRQAVQALTKLGPEVQIMPMRELAVHIADLAASYRLSALAAEAVAAAEQTGADLCVWDGDRGPNISACCAAVGVRYRTIRRA